MGLLDGRGALVTGGASGIGRATALRLAAEGARVCVLDVDAAGAEAVAAEIDGLARPVDVCDLAALEAACADAAAAFGGLHVLVNNAGAGMVASVERIDPAHFERLVRVNLVGTFHGLRAAAPHLRRAAAQAPGRAAVVNNASMSGVRATRGEAPYSAAKAGVIALTQAAALELAPAVRVNCVSPGMIRTAMSEPLFRMDGMLDPVEHATPLARTGTAEDVADAIVFLASDLARFVTGHNLAVDGGLGVPQAGTDDMLRRLLALLEPDSGGTPGG